MQIIVKLIGLVAIVAIAAVAWSEVKPTAKPTESVQGQKNAGAPGPGGGRPGNANSRGRGAPRDTLEKFIGVNAILLNLNRV